MADKIKMLIMDVDGTLTDGKVYYGESGEEMKAFHIKDGLGIVKIQKYGVVPVIITGRKSAIVERRARELSVKEVYQGVVDKVGAADRVFEKYGIEADEAAYIGDDENDLAVMSRCGIVGCPQDAAEAVKDISTYVAKSKGGEGAVREFIEWLLKRQGAHDGDEVGGRNAEKNEGL